MKCVLDSSALIALYRDEEGAARVDDLISDPRNRCAIHALNMCEVLYHFGRYDGWAVSNAILAHTLTMGVKIIEPFGPVIWKRAAELKTTYKSLALGDAIGIAYTVKEDAAFITGDHGELDTLDDDGACNIIFFRERKEARH